MLSPFLEKNKGNFFSPIVRGGGRGRGLFNLLKFVDPSGLTLLGVVTMEVHVRLMCLSISTDVLNRILLPQLLLRWFLAAGYFSALFFALLDYGCMGAGFKSSLFVWASIFSFTTVGWNDFLCLCCCLNRCCGGQVASGSCGKVPRTVGSCRHPMR